MGCLSDQREPARERENHTFPMTHCYLCARFSGPRRIYKKNMRINSLFKSFQDPKPRRPNHNIAFEKCGFHAYRRVLEGCLLDQREPACKRESHTLPMKNCYLGAGFSDSQKFSKVIQINYLFKFLRNPKTWRPNHNMSLETCIFHAHRWVVDGFS